MGISQSSVVKILHEELAYKAYKIQLVQLLKPQNIQRRMEFSQIIINSIVCGTVDPKKIWFSDECHFYLHGFVNKQNHRIWGSKNPHTILKRPLHPKIITVWIKISENGFIGPYIFFDTVNGDRYLKMLMEFSIPRLYELEMGNEFWWQQDGSTAHRTIEVKNYIRDHCSDRVIGLGFESEDGREIEWRPYSSDLNPCDFFLWGMMKEYVYQQGPKTVIGVVQIFDICLISSVVSGLSSINK